MPRLYRNYDYDQGLNQEMFEELKLVNIDSEAAKIARRLYGLGAAS